MNIKRTARWAVSIIIAMLCILLATNSTRLTCGHGGSAAAGRCLLRTRFWPLAASDTWLPASDIRDVRVQNWGSASRNNWLIVLVDTAGRQIELPAENEEEALAGQDRLQRFLSGSRPSASIENGPHLWLLILPVLCLFIGFREPIWASRLGGTAPITSAYPSMRTTHRGNGWWSRRTAGVRAWLIMAGIVVLITCIGLPIELWYDNTYKGWLSVRCDGRCRLDNVECLPGGGLKIATSPGIYWIDLWRPDLPSKWDPQAVVVKRGSTTYYVCRPSGR